MQHIFTYSSKHHPRQCGRHLDVCQKYIAKVFPNSFTSKQRRRNFTVNISGTKSCLVSCTFTLMEEGTFWDYTSEYIMRQFLFLGELFH